MSRPPKFSTPEEMEPLIEQYFMECSKGKIVKHFDMKRKTVVSISEQIPCSMERLSLNLGFSSVAGLWEYNKKPAFVDLLARARTLVVADVVEGTMTGRYPANFAPFRLCNMDRDNYKSINKPEINIGIGLSEAPKKLNMANMRIIKSTGPKLLADKRKTAGNS